jgi:hypothetical protein
MADQPAAAPDTVGLVVILSGAAVIAIAGVVIAWLRYRAGGDRGTRE